jgi:hypothetical protein
MQHPPTTNKIYSYQSKRETPQSCDQFGMQEQLQSKQVSFAENIDWTKAYANSEPGSRQMKERSRLRKERKKEK